MDILCRSRSMNCVKPGVKQAQLRVILRNYGILDLILKQKFLLLQCTITYTCGAFA